MKRMQKILLVLALLLSSGSFGANAQIYVGIRPTIPVYVRAERPSPRHVWVDEEWVWRDGHWAEPPQVGYVWVGGRWHHERDGYRWERGHWDHGRGHGYGRGHRDRD